MKSSYNEQDVVLLLKDITGMVEPLPAQEREILVQSGRHYSEMLPIEYVPTEEYMRVYYDSLEVFAQVNANAIANLAERVVVKRGKNLVLVSLARAGIPIGILLKRYLKYRYDMDIMHYSISIIRDRGIDSNAMKYLLQRYEPSQLLFVDGWIGKGAIYNELRKELLKYPGVSSDIAVVADPANVTSLYGTHDDILIPSSCLNSTVSGLISRTFLRSDVIGKNDFHGAVFYKDLEKVDLSYHFIDAIVSKFVESPMMDDHICEGSGIDEVKAIADEYGVKNINFIKPGIGETTRVLLRRIPWKILVDRRYRDSLELRHLIRLANERGVSVEEYTMNHYKCCGIIRKMADT